MNRALDIPPDAMLERYCHSEEELEQLPTYDEPSDFTNNEWHMRLSADELAELATDNRLDELAALKANAKSLWEEVALFQTVPVVLDDMMLAKNSDRFALLDVMQGTNECMKRIYLKVGKDRWRKLDSDGNYVSEEELLVDGEYGLVSLFGESIKSPDLRGKITDNQEMESTATLLLDDELVVMESTVPLSSDDEHLEELQLYVKNNIKAVTVSAQPLLSALSEAE
ncbi:MAG: hypothetical protein ACREOZ_02530, partial [Gloeomargaritales cyanobacterium]